MEYKDFIAKLYIKGAWLTKADFTKKLILSSVNDDSRITEKRKSESLYKGFNSGRPINAVAYDVLKDLNRPGIVAFLRKYISNKPDEKSANIQTLCDKFKDDIPDITPENLCERIVDFFVEEVLSSAAKEYEKTLASLKTASSKKVPAPVQKSKDTDELAGLKALINELNALFTELDEKGSVLYISPFQRSEEEQNEKEQELEALKLMCKLDEGRQSGEQEC